jgi:hypothetical protein
MSLILRQKAISLRNLFLLTLCFLSHSNEQSAWGQEKASPLESKPNEAPKKDRISIKDPKEKFKAQLSMTMEPFRLVLLDGSGPGALFGMEAALEANTAVSAAIIQENWPRIRSAFFEDLYGILSLFWQTGYTASIKSLEKRLLRIGQKFFGPGVLKRVKIQRAYFHPFKPI